MEVRRAVLAWTALVACAGLVPVGTADDTLCEPSPDAEARTALYRETLACGTDPTCLDRANTRWQAILGRDMRVYAHYVRAFAADRARAERTLRERRDASPKDPFLVTAHGLALPADSDEPMTAYAKALELEPSFAWAHFHLAERYTARGSQRRDPEKAKPHVRAWLAACPADAAGLTMAGALDDRAIAADAARAARRVLENATGETVPRRYESLWTLEFKGSPPSEHEAVRARIRADIARIKKMGDGSAFALAVLKGFELTGEVKERDAARQDLIARFPCELDSVKVRVSDWDAAHPRPAASADETARREYEQARYAHQSTIAAACPANPMVASSRARAARSLGDLPVKDVEAVLDDFMAARAASPTLIPPLAVADAPVELAVAYRVRLEVVPELIRTWREGPKMKAPPVDAPESQRQMHERMLRRTEFDQTWLMARADNLGGRRQETDEGLARLEGLVEPAGYDRSRMEAQIAWLRAEMAEQTDHLADAVVFYQAAAAGLRNDALFRRSSQEALRRLGASESSLAALMPARRTTTTVPSGAMTSTSIVTRRPSSPWKEIERPLPAGSLDRIGGGRWILQDDLKGKRTLVNVWATWCEPCKKELPELQRLHDRIKGRSDLAIVSLNVDENPGLVEPFVKEKGYTFPVVLGVAFWDSLKLDQGIPTNWILDDKGVARAETRGFGDGGGDAWVEAALAALEGKTDAKAAAAK